MLYEADKGVDVYVLDNGMRGAHSLFRSHRIGDLLDGKKYCEPEPVSMNIIRSRVLVSVHC
jgi:hypothetical protein